MTPYAHPWPTRKCPQHLLRGFTFYTTLDLVKPSLGLPIIDILTPAILVAMYKPLERVDPSAWRNVIELADLHGPIVWRDTWERSAIRTETE